MTVSATPRLAAAGGSALGALPGRALAVCAVLGAVILVYLPGLHGPFLFDDLTSIIGNPYLAISSLDWDALLTAARSGQSGALGRPLAYLSFGLDYWVWQGFSPAGFKSTNLAIHVLDTVLVYRLARLLLAAASGERADGANHWPLALLAAALWGLHPLQLTSVLYTVQRMTSLSAFGVLAGLVVFMEGRLRLAARPRLSLLLMGLGLVGGAVLGLAAKENAILIVLFAGVIEISLCSRGDLAPAERTRLRRFYLLLVGLPIAVGALALALHPGFVLDGYRERTYGPWERLLTEGRVLFYYLGLLALPRIDELALVHDDFAVSTGLWHPWTTAVSLAGWAVLVAGAFWQRRSHPWLGFALGWFLVGHAIESGVVPLDLVHEHRNYLPSFGPLLAAAWYLGRVRPAWRGTLAAAALVLLGGVTAVRASVWENEDVLTRALVRHHPGSARAHGLRAQLLIDAGAPAADVYAALVQVARLDRANVTALAEMLRIVAGSLPPEQAARAVRAAAPGDPYQVRLPQGATALAVRAGALAAEMERRLREEPVGAGTVQALYELAACVERGEPRCAPLAQSAREWPLEVLARHRLAGRFRAVLWGRVAHLSAARDPERAAALLERAEASQPGNQGYLVDLVRLRVARGEWAQAAAAFPRACAGVGSPGRRALARLGAAIEQAAGTAVRCP